MTRDLSLVINRLSPGVLAFVALLTALSTSRAQTGPGYVTFNNNSSCKIIIGQTGQPATTNDNVHAALYWAAAASNTFVQIGASVTVGVPGSGLFAGGIPYTLQFSSDGLAWRTVASGLTGSVWQGPYPGGERGYYQVTQP